MPKTLVVTEKKSVAEDFAKVNKVPKKGDMSFESDRFVIAWASGHLLELKSPDAYDKKFKRWALGDLPIVPERFEHQPRGDDKKSADLLKNLVKQINREDVERVVNACDAGREGELIFNLILDHSGMKGKKPVVRMWLQSMTARAIDAAFEELKVFDGAASGKKATIRSAGDFRDLADAAYARDEADWLIGMNGTRAFTKGFMGRAKQIMAVGRVKTPTLAFLVDREREIDAFVPVPYHQIDAVFRQGDATWEGRWSGPDADGRKTDRFLDRAIAERIHAAVSAGKGTVVDTESRKKEEPPLLYDLTSLQRAASAQFGYTLDRTLSLVQTLYEQKKAVTYPRTSSRFLPTDYKREITPLLLALRQGPLGHAAAQVPPDARPEIWPRVFNDAKVSDHFALIPTGENPGNMRDDEARIYEMITRRFLAAFMPSAEWLHVSRETNVGGEAFFTKGRRLSISGWRAVEPATEDAPLPAIDSSKPCDVTSATILDKETQAPGRYTDGSLVKAMETAGRDTVPGAAVEGRNALDEEALEELKERGLGTPATRAAIVKDLIQKGLARRQGRSILPTPLGCTLVRVVRNLGLDGLAKPEMTGEWEYRLALMAQGKYDREQFTQDMSAQVRDIIEAIRSEKGGNDAVFVRDHGTPTLLCPLCGKPLLEKTFSYMCDEKKEGCGFNLSKDQNGKYLFPETARRLLDRKRIGPMSGFDRTSAAGWLNLEADGSVRVELDAKSDEEETPGEEGGFAREIVPEGLVIGTCPKPGCGGTVRREGSGYKCEKNIARAKDKTCDFRLAERIKYRYLPLAEVKKMIAGQKTEPLFGFVSMRGKKFRAMLYYENGDLKWEFPPRPERPARAAKGKKAAEDGAEGAAAEGAAKKPARRTRAKKGAAAESTEAPPAAPEAPPTS